MDYLRSKKPRSLSACPNRWAFFLFQKSIILRQTDFFRIFTAQIAATDKEIDNMVYQLYDLTEDEIKVLKRE